MHNINVHNKSSGCCWNYREYKTYRHTSSNVEPLDSKLAPNDDGYGENGSSVEQDKPRDIDETLITSSSQQVDDTKIASAVKDEYDDDFAEDNSVKQEASVVSKAGENEEYYDDDFA